MLLRALPHWVSKNSRDGNCTTSWGNLFHCCAVIMGKKVSFHLQSELLTSSYAHHLSSCHHALLWRACLCLLSDLLVARGKLLRGPPQSLPFSRLKQLHPSASPCRADAPAPEHPGGPPLGLLQFGNVSVLGREKNDAVHKMSSHDCQVKGDNHFS